MTATAAQVLATAASQVGTKESGGKNRIKYWALKPEWNGSPWCATFVQWVLREHGMSYPAPLPYYCPSIEATARKAGKWISKGNTPQPGDLVLYGSGSESVHVGFVVRALSGGRIETIEGNTSSGLGGSQSNGDGVYRRVRDIGWVRGYVRMSYAAPAKAKPSKSPAKVKSSPAAKSTLARGSKGEAVKRLQRGLRIKFPAYARIAVDGSFGPATEKAVREFQRRSRLEVDGRVGPRTQAELRKYGITL